MYTVEFYKDVNDHCEIGEYFAELAEKAKTDKNARINMNKIAKASDKVAKGAGEKVNLDPAESVAYLIGKFKEKHII